MIASSVISAVTGAARKPLVHDSTISPSTTLCEQVPQAVGARLSPMSATMVPVTTGGMSASIQRVPATCTTAPMAASSTPTTTMPPSATDCPPLAVAALMGAMNANDEPR